jgi:hypothetical protein
MIGRLMDQLVEVEMALLTADAKEALILETIRTDLDQRLESLRSCSGPVELRAA